MRAIAFVLTSVAVLMTAGSASADDNFARLGQTGDGNSSAVTQGPGDGNRAGTDLLAVTQDGNDNVLTILQSGDGNAIGTEGTGLLQDSNRNTATITQSSDDNIVGQVTQTGIASAAGGASLRRNVLSIAQESGDGNRVGVVVQTRDASSLNAPANTATLTQTGAGNEIAKLLQSGAAEIASVTQTGDDNGLELIEQHGARNLASINISGDGNGRSAFDAGSGVDGAWRGLGQGQVYQNNDFAGAGFADANTLTLAIAGDGNSYGFSQIGTGNTVTGAVGGDANQVGAVQLGIGNTASFTLDGADNRAFVDQGRWEVNIGNEADVLITGSGNGAGVLQSGTNNAATAVIIGDGNLVNIDQESVLLGNLADLTIDGNDNVVALTQSDSNEATLRITGHSNQLAASQDGLGNALEITLWGSDNNSTGSSFSGVALDTALLTAPDLAPGRIIQTGAGNSIVYDVGTASAPSDGNRFAFAQLGYDNHIIGSTRGSGNQVAIVQEGAANFVSFMQNGVGNVIGVSQ